MWHTIFFGILGDLWIVDFGYRTPEVISVSSIGSLEENLKSNFDQFYKSLLFILKNIVKFENKLLFCNYYL